MPNKNLDQNHDKGDKGLLKSVRQDAVTRMGGREGGVQLVVVVVVVGGLKGDKWESKGARLLLYCCTMHILPMHLVCNK